MNRTGVPLALWNPDSWAFRFTDVRVGADPADALSVISGPVEPLHSPGPLIFSSESVVVKYRQPSGPTTSVPSA